MLWAHWLFTGEVNVLKSYYDVLPSPSNLFCCGKVESPACHLCSGRGTLDEALDEGHYHWHHGQVLKTIAEDRMEDANERKRSKYAELVKECQSNGEQSAYPLRWGAGDSSATFLCRA